jgi:hypothetical protein
MINVVKGRCNQYGTTVCCGKFLLLAYELIEKKLQLTNDWVKRATFHNSRSVIYTIYAC